jgi:hypothetical protein
MAVNGKSIPDEIFPRAIVMVARIINIKPVLDRPQGMGSLRQKSKERKLNEDK